MKESGINDRRVLLDQADMDWVPEDMAELEHIDVLFYSPKWNPQLVSGQMWDENSRTLTQVTLQSLGDASGHHKGSNLFHFCGVPGETLATNRLTPPPLGNSPMFAILTT